MESGYAAWRKGRGLTGGGLGGVSNASATQLEDVLAKEDLVQYFVLKGCATVKNKKGTPQVQQGAWVGSALFEKVLWECTMWDMMSGTDGHSNGHTRVVGSRQTATSEIIKNSRKKERRDVIAVLDSRFDHTKELAEQRSTQPAKFARTWEKITAEKPTELLCLSKQKLQLICTVMMSSAFHAILVRRLLEVPLMHTIVKKPGRERTEFDLLMLSKLVQGLKSFENVPAQFLRDMCHSSSFAKLCAGELYYSNTDIPRLCIVISGQLQ
eukprot:gene20884-25044_t